MNRTRLLSYLQDKFAAPVASMAQLFDSVALIDESRRDALAWSQCGLFLMIFVPGVYFDPVSLRCYASQLFVHVSAFYAVSIVE